MKLVRTYSKIIISRNYLKNIVLVLSIMLAYLFLSLSIISINKIFNLSSDSVYSEMRYLYISILTIFLIAGVSLIIYQCLDIMRAGIRSYCKLQGLGANKRNIRLLILIQVFSLLILYLPVGLMCGYMLTDFVLNLLRGVSDERNLLKIITSFTSLVPVEVIIGSLIISAGLYLDRGVSKMPMENIQTGKFTKNLI